MAKKLAKLIDRVDAATAYLDARASAGRGSANAELLADAYQWIYQSGRAGPWSPGLEDLRVHWVRWQDAFDVLLEGGEVLPEIARRAEIERLHAPSEAWRSLSQMPRQPRVIVSPQFDQSFQHVPTLVRPTVVARLKELTVWTVQQNAKTDPFAGNCRTEHGISYMEVGPGVMLVVEPQAADGACFLGFSVAGDGVSLGPAQATQERGGLSRASKGVLALAALGVLGALLYLPYDVIVVEGRESIRVFGGYEFLWSAPDIADVCAAHSTPDIFGEGAVKATCYSVIAMPRVALAAMAAAFVLALATLLTGAWRTLGSRHG